MKKRYIINHSPFIDPPLSSSDFGGSWLLSSGVCYNTSFTLYADGLYYKMIFVKILFLFSFLCNFA